MSVRAAIIAHLVSKSYVRDLVEERVSAQKLPVPGSDFPAITLKSADLGEVHTLGGYAGLAEATVDLIHWDLTPEGCLALEQATTRAMRDHFGYFANVRLGKLERINEHDDFEPEIEAHYLNVSWLIEFKDT